MYKSQSTSHEAASKLGIFNQGTEAQNSDAKNKDSYTLYILLSNRSIRMMAFLEGDKSDITQLRDFFAKQLFSDKPNAEVKDKMASGELVCSYKLDEWSIAWGKLFGGETTKHEKGSNVSLEFAFPSRGGEGKLKTRHLLPLVIGVTDALELPKTDASLPPPVEITNIENGIFVQLLHQSNVNEDNVIAAFVAFESAAETIRKERSKLSTFSDTPSLFTTSGGRGAGAGGEASIAAAGSSSSSSMRRSGPL